MTLSFKILLFFLSSFLYKNLTFAASNDAVLAKIVAIPESNLNPFQNEDFYLIMLDNPNYMNNLLHRWYQYSAAEINAIPVGCRPLLVDPGITQYYEKFKNYVSTLPKSTEHTCNCEQAAATQCSYTRLRNEFSDKELARLVVYRGFLLKLDEVLKISHEGMKSNLLRNDNKAEKTQILNAIFDDKRLAPSIPSTPLHAIAHRLRAGTFKFQHRDPMQSWLLSVTDLKEIAASIPLRCIALSSDGQIRPEYTNTSLWIYQLNFRGVDLVDMEHEGKLHFDLGHKNPWNVLSWDNKNNKWIEKKYTIGTRAVETFAFFNIGLNSISADSVERFDLPLVNKHEEVSSDPHHTGRQYFYSLDGPSKLLPALPLNDVCTAQSF